MGQSIINPKLSHTETRDQSTRFFSLGTESPLPWVIPSTHLIMIRPWPHKKANNHIQACHNVTYCLPGAHKARIFLGLEEKKKAYSTQLYHCRTHSCSSQDRLPRWVRRWVPDSSFMRVHNPDPREYTGGREWCLKATNVNPKGQ